MNIDRVFQASSSEFYRCGEQGPIQHDPGKSLNDLQKADADIRENIFHAFWMDDVLRATEYYDIEVWVKDGRVFLGGHVISTANHTRILKAVRSIAEISEIKDYLILDDRLTLVVAGSLAGLEHEYQCKFFTSVSHGIVSLSGFVGAKSVGSLAEKCAAANPNVRGVINNVRVKGSIPELVDQSFLQPTIGESIYCLDGMLGVVKFVVINPDNRRVQAMIVQTEPLVQVGIQASGEKIKSEYQLVIVPMDAVRNITKVSGFLNVSSKETETILGYVSDQFFVPDNSWMPPYPYCPDDVLFPASYKQMDHSAENLKRRISLMQSVEGRIPVKELPADYSLSG